MGGLGEEVVNKPEESSHQNLTMLAPRSQSSSLQNCEKTNFSCLSHSVHGILLWQPEHTETEILGTAERGQMAAGQHGNRINRI